MSGICSLGEGKDGNGEAQHGGAEDSGGPGESAGGAECQTSREKTGGEETDPRPNQRRQKEKTQQRGI